MLWKFKLVMAKISNKHPFHKVDVMGVYSRGHLFNNFPYTKGRLIQAGCLFKGRSFENLRCVLLGLFQYIAFRARNADEVLISTKRAARNMAFQGLTHEEEKIDVLVELIGDDILGCGLKAPLTSNSVIYTLPMLTIKEDKGIVNTLEYYTSMCKMAVAKIV